MSRQVLGTVVIGGMLAASLVAIFFIPVTFDLVERFGSLFDKKEPRELEDRSHDANANAQRHDVVALGLRLQGRPELPAPDSGRTGTISRVWRPIFPHNLRIRRSRKCNGSQYSRTRYCRN